MIGRRRLFALFTDRDLDERAATIAERRAGTTTGGSMRHVATVIATAGALTPSPAPAFLTHTDLAHTDLAHTALTHTVLTHADGGFWRSAGLARVDAFGVYRTSRGRVRVSFLLKDRKKRGRGGVAMRFTFTERHRPNAVRVVALRSQGPRKSWHTVTSANTDHLYAQECLGTWHGTTFRMGRCGGWRRRY